MYSFLIFNIYSRGNTTFTYHLHVSFFSSKGHRDRMKKFSTLSSSSIYLSCDSDDSDEEDSDEEERNHQGNQKVVEMKFAGNR